jgi:hypothetical protein
MSIGAAIFLFAAFVGNTRLPSWRILALIGWLIGVIGIGIHFYDFYRFLKEALKRRS